MQAQLKPEENGAVPLGDSTSRTVRVLRSIEEVESAREFWSSCPGSLDSDIDVLLLAHASTREAPRPCVHVLYRGGKPFALMAGRIFRTRFVFRLGWLSLFEPLVNVLTIRGGMRGDASPESCQELVRGIIQCLKNGEADVAVLKHVEADSALFHCAKSESGALFRDHFTSLRPHRKRELPGSVDQLYADLSGHERKRFRQIAKKLSSDFAGKVRVDRLDTVADLDRTLEVVEQIAKKTWQRNVGGGSHMDAWLLETFKTLAEKGWLRVYTLYLADKPCAFWIGALYWQTFFSEYTGYDQDYADYSVGTYLLSRVMEELCSEGAKAIDFGASDEEYKKRFGNVTWRETDLHLFAPSPKGFALSALRATTVFLHESSRAFLMRTNLIQRAKKMWRRVSDSKQKTNEARS